MTGRGARAPLGAWTLALLVGTASFAASAPSGALSLERLAKQVARDVRTRGAPPPVAVYVRGESADLARAFATMLAAELSQAKLSPFAVQAPTPAAAEAEARTAGARSLIRLTVSLESGLLLARGDVLGTWVNFWSGALPTRPPSPAFGVEGSTEADAHALALAAEGMGPPLATSARGGPVRMQDALFARLEGHTAAVAAGDLDGDGKDEVVALTDASLFAFSPGGKLLARREHPDTLPLSPSPSREPVGQVAVLPSPPRVAWRSGQRARGEVLALEGPRGGFEVLGPQEDAVLGEVGGALYTAQLKAGLNVFAPKVGSPGGEWTLPEPFTSASVHAGPEGTRLLFVGPDGKGYLRDGRGEAAGADLLGLGAASALVDVDGDGHPEVATTEPAFAPAPEVLRLLAGPSSPGDAEPLRLRQELPRGRALQVCGADLDGDGAQELLVALWLADGTTELRVFRRVP